MNNFYYYNPTKILFGEGMIERLRFELPDNARVLLVYGQGSIKKNGVYEQVIRALDGVEHWEFGGITPNPEYQQCLEAVRFGREMGVNFLLAIGGGSVIDAVKFISLCMYHDGVSPWNFLIGDSPKPSRAMPFGCVLTSPATGSEVNNAFVISDCTQKEKVTCHSYQSFPQFSVIDPSIATTLPKTQIANAIVDTFVHVLEQYVTVVDNSALLQDRQAEAILLTVKEIGPLLINHPENIKLWQTFSWCASQAMSGLINRGVSVDWSTHHISHHLTALYQIEHAKTLAIVLPGVWKALFSQKQEKLIQYGHRVWGLSGTSQEVARKACELTEQFFQQLGMPTRLSHYGLSGKEVAQAVTSRMFPDSQPLGNTGMLEQAVVKAILESRH